MTSTRRDAIKTTGAFATLVSLGIITQAQANAAVTHDSFAVKTLEDALKAIGGTAATSDQVSVVSPDIAENGAVVPVGATSKLPNTTEMYLIVEKNPTPAVGRIHDPRRHRRRRADPSEDGPEHERGRRGQGRRQAVLGQQRNQSDAGWLRRLIASIAQRSPTCYH